MASPRALLSVWEKTGIHLLASELESLGWEIISTGGTARILRDSGLPITDVSEITNHPEVFDGRVKTLHPAVHAGILSRRNVEKDMDTLESLGYQPIDLVCVNLYPFEETAEREPPASISELIEMIDIGGPTMIRSAAKNHSDVIVLTNPEQYQEALDDLARSGGDPSGIGLERRKELALAAFQCSASYDASVATELEKRFSDSTMPSRLHISSGIGTELRYGENPHQAAFFYPDSDQHSSGLSLATQSGGKPLSYNNYLDLDSALKVARSLISGFPEHHSCVIVKHTNPCGASVDESQKGAWKNALSSDPESAFGCVVAFTHKVQLDTALEIGDHFFECMIAPGYEPEAMEVLSTKKNRRMMTLDPLPPRDERIRIRQVDGGWLSQTQGLPDFDWLAIESVTEKQLEDADINLAKFGCLVIAETKSNAILLVSESETGLSTVGVGPGQTSRVEAVRIASARAGDRANGSMLVSDAFFPFRDSIDSANQVGVRAVVQPGGSVRDNEVIEAANEYGISMIFTGTRLFLH